MSGGGQDNITADWIRRRIDRGEGREFDARFIVFARKLALMGCSQPEIARNLGADRPTFYTWKREYPEFANALDAGKFLANFAVTEALYKRCVGFKVTKTTQYKDGSSSTTEEYVVPDVPAIRYWLTNRCGKHWKPEQVVRDTAAPPNQGDLNARMVEFPGKQAEGEATADAPVTVPARNPVDADSKA
jgi:hypothetical protein